MHVNFVKVKSWIDFSSELEVGETKNAEGRTVYRDDELKQIFEQQHEARKKQKKLIPYVFPNKEGDDKIKDFRGAWNAACKKVGIGKRLFHDFRRTAVRNMTRSVIQIFKWLPSCRMNILSPPRAQKRRQFVILKKKKD